jgi:hypothetical protein
VDTTVEDFCKKLLLLSMEANGVQEVPFIWFWPDGATACHMMTQDVESKAGGDRCADSMDVDDSFGIKASFSSSLSNAMLFHPTCLPSFAVVDLRLQFRI